MKRKVAPFGNDLVRLRLIERKDLETTLSWRNRDESRIWFKSSNLLTIDQHLAWFSQYIEKDNDFLFVIEYSKKVVGQASVYDVQWGTGTAEVGRFLVSPAESGKGYIREACKLLICFCRRELSLCNLYLSVFETNSRAIRIYEDAGFVPVSKENNMVRMEWRSR